MRNMEIAYIVALLQASKLLWLRHIAFLHFQVCFPLLPSLLPFFFDYELLYNKQTNAAYNIIIHRNESASFTKQLSARREL